MGSQVIQQEKKKPNKELGFRTSNLLKHPSFKKSAKVVDVAEKVVRAWKPDS
jgi:hypothetical protein